MERGLRVDHFEILEQLGAGGMGLVFRARDQVLHRDVALKVIQPGRASSEARQRFLDEARIAATLTHPNITAVYEAGELQLAPGEPPQIYVAQELVEGETLTARVARGVLPLDEVTNLGVQLLDALDDAHARGIVHRDIKPSNLMITPRGRLKILDFGIAKRLNLPDATTRVGGSWPTDVEADATIIGTPGYMAPEQLRGIADPRSDLYATGCVLFELLTARRLFSSAVRAGTGPSDAPAASAMLRTLRPDVPLALAMAIEQAVASDPRERFVDAGSFAAALRNVVVAPAEKQPRPRWPRAGSWPARAELAAASILVLGVLTFGLWRWSQPTLAFTERDWVLVANVVNETDETVFDSAIDGALATDLRQSRYVNVFDDGQLANALTAMRLPPATKIDLQTGRDVCRLAGIRVLLVPRILSVGGAYQLEASLIEPSSGREVDRLRVTAKGREEVLLKGIDDFTRLVRERLGESLPAIEKSDPQLVEYATRSWEALRYIRLAGEAVAAADIPRATRAFEQALEHDPEFPAALGSLGLIHIEFLAKPEEGKRMLASALEHSSPASEREYFMIRALNKQFVTGDPMGALDDYRFVSTLHPDLFQPYNNSGRILIRLGKYAEAVTMFEKAHALDPRHTGPLWNLWELRLNGMRDPAGAEVHARALADLQPQNPWIRHVGAWTDVALRRFEPAEQGMREVLSKLPLHPYAFPNLGHLLMRRGAAREAVDVYRELLNKAQAELVNISTLDVGLFLGLALTADGRREEAREVYESEIGKAARKAGAPPAPLTEARLSVLNAAAGHPRLAESLATRALEREGSNPWVLYTLARTRALLGDADRAADLLRRAGEAGYEQPYFVLIDPVFRALQDHPAIPELAAPSRPAG